MTRKVIDAIKDPSTLDDKDYYGNKRCQTRWCNNRASASLMIVEQA
jgi:hypothetical protein